MEHNNKKFLVVIDAQNDFIDGVLGSKEAVAAVPNIINKIKNERYEHIFFTKDTHDKETYLDTIEGKKLPVVHCVYGTNGYEVRKDIVEAADKYASARIAINKNTFASLDLAEMMQDIVSKRTRLVGENGEASGDKIEEIELVGFCTDICVVSNALMLKAYLSDYQVEITVDASCCAGVTPEKHKAALEVMKSCQINIVNE